jgi:hypothetical protein
MNKPYYKKRPIGSLAALCRTLRISEAILNRITSHTHDFYSPHEVPKKNSDKKRQINIPNTLLKIIQKRINREIFENVHYPNYLYGGLKDKDYVRNAKYHCPAEIIITIDVKDFYPSIKEQHVKRIYTDLFKFNEPVAEALTKLTTLKGSVPQGGCCSSYIANLVLFDVESHKVNYIESMGFKYTRLLDDICVSSKKNETEKRIECVITSIASMLKSKNLKINNKKKSITTRANPENLMSINGVWIDRGHPRAHRSERDEIKSEVFSIEKLAQKDPTLDEYHKKHNSASGRVAKLQYLAHVEAKSLRLRLQNILPKYNEVEIAKTKNIVQSLARSKHDDRESFDYITRYHQTLFRVNIVARSNAQLARRLRKTLRECRPSIKYSDHYYENEQA